MDQIREFLGSFEELCTKALINHCTTSKDYVEVDELIKEVVQIVKDTLHKYGC